MLNTDKNHKKEVKPREQSDTGSIKEYLQNKYSQSTLNSNLYNIHLFTDYYGKKAPQANYKDVLAYIAYQRKNYDISPRTLRHRLYGVKIYFNYLMATGQRQDHPCSELYLKDKIDKSIKVDTLHSTQRLERFYETYRIKKKTRLESRNKIIISLLIYQALMVGEIAALRVDDIDLHKGEIFIGGKETATAKSPKSRTLPLQARQILPIHEYLQKDRKKLLEYNKEPGEEAHFILGHYGEPVNPHCISEMINAHRPESERITPMKIRQSVIANLLKKENDTRVVQVFAGHRRASTTAQYKQSDLEALKTAIETYHPIR